MKIFFNSPRRSKSEETIGLGSVNLSGNGGEEIIRFSGHFWSTMSLPYSIFVSVTVDCLGTVGISDSSCGRAVSSLGEITCPDLNLSSLHCFCSILGFGFSTI